MRALALGAHNGKVTCSWVLCAPALGVLPGVVMLRGGTRRPLLPRGSGVMGASEPDFCTGPCLVGAKGGEQARCLNALQPICGVLHSSIKGTCKSLGCRAQCRPKRCLSQMLWVLTCMVGVPEAWGLPSLSRGTREGAASRGARKSGRLRGMEVASPSSLLESESYSEDDPLSESCPCWPASAGVSCASSAAACTCCWREGHGS